MKSADKKCWEKNRRKKLRKIFLYSREYRVQKMEGKNARNYFSRNTPIERAKNVGNKSSQKSAKKSFLYSYEYRDQKMGGKKRETIFPETLE